MARRPGEEGRFTLSRRSRLIAGWVAAIAVFVLIALAVGFLGGDGSPIAPGTSPSASAGGPLTIAFGTTLDAASGEVPAEARVERFAADDTFAYSVPPRGELPSTVYVEVERVSGGALGIVQGTAEGEQSLPEGRSTIAFTVPAANLLEVFGPGEYVMRIFLDPTEEPFAEGGFVLVGDPSASPTESQPSP